jgi:hypothetical protein
MTEFKLYIRANTAKKQNETDQSNRIQNRDNKSTQHYVCVCNTYK